MEKFKIFGYANLAGKRELLEASKNQLIDLNEFTKINHLELLAAPRAALTKDYTQNLVFNRNISIDTANVYDIGYDELNRHITFPIRDVYKNCIGIGRRSIDMKQYLYPPGMIKPLYGVYELPNMVRHLWVVEGPFNLWSLYEYGKTGIALLGTGTSHQYYELIKLNCDDYVLALDPDDAGRKGISKLGTFLLNNTNKKIYVALLPNGRDVNDLSCEEFKTVPIVTLKEWGTLFNVYF